MDFYSPITWTFDLLPDNHRYLTFLKKVFRHEFRKNGFRRISVPQIENKELLKNIEQSQYFLLENDEFDFLQDPEVWILRAYLDKNQQEKIQPVYYYFMDQFYKKDEDWKLKSIEAIWWEIIWEDDPILDAIQIHINCMVLNKIGLGWKFEVIINSMWNEKEREKFKEELSNYYGNKDHILSEKSKEFFKENPMLVLRATGEDEIILNKNAPNFAEKFIKKESKAHYTRFKEYLNILDIPYKESNLLVTDKKYTTNSIWRFESLDWKIISEWFRHNALAKMLWEPKEIPATGFYSDAQIIVQMLVDYWVKIKNKDKIDLFFVQLWDEAKKAVLPLSLKAREAWINTVSSFWTPSMKEQMLKANRVNAKFIVLVWVMEARNWVFQVRNWEDWTQEEVKKEDLIDYIIDKIWQENLDFYSPEKDFLIE